MPHAPRHDADAPVGLLLAGGSGRRAGVDKRYLVLGGRTLLERNLAFLQRRFDRVVVSLAPAQEADFGDAGDVEIVRDAWPGTSPLAGIASALAALRRPVFALAVDLAFPDDEALSRVLAAAPGHDVAIPAIGAHHEPLFAVYGPACLAPMAALLDAGEHRIVEILPSVRVAEVAFADESAFRNINTMDDFADAQRTVPRDATAQPALVAVVGKSDSGKTTLVERLIPALSSLGLRVGSVKHDAHSFEIGHPCKDSWRHGQAGGEAYAVASPERLAFVTRLEAELPLEAIARRFFAGFDIVVAEGYKRTAPHRVEVFRRGAGHEAPLCDEGEALAFVTDADLPGRRCFALDDAAGLARFLATRLQGLRRY
jgi:molybdopterin-guanine dinucleotide biosynthesis protein